MLKDYEKLLLDQKRGDESVCIVAADIIDGKLRLGRIDFGEWEMNRRTGTVECYYCVDAENTEKLRLLFGVKTSAQLIAAIAKACRDRSGIAYTANFRDLCDDNNINYDYQVWY